MDSQDGSRGKQLSESSSLCTRLETALRSSLAAFQGELRSSKTELRSSLAEVLAELRSLRTEL